MYLRISSGLAFHYVDCIDFRIHHYTGSDVAICNIMNLDFSCTFTYKPKNIDIRLVFDTMINPPCIDLTDIKDHYKVFNFDCDVINDFYPVEAGFDPDVLEEV